MPRVLLKIAARKAKGIRVEGKWDFFSSSHTNTAGNVSKINIGNVCESVNTENILSFIVPKELYANHVFPCSTAIRHHSMPNCRHCAPQPQKSTKPYMSMK